MIVTSTISMLVPKGVGLSNWQRGICLNPNLWNLRINRIATQFTGASFEAGLCCG
jgi:hypothetical protein